MAKKQAQPIIPADKLLLYEKVVATIPGLERKGVTMPYTSINGHMFSFLAKNGSMALRLPKPTRDDFIAKYQTSLVEAYGAVMKEYVVVPEALLQSTTELQPYF